MIKIVFLDIDDTLLSFSGYVKEAMRDGFALYGLPPYEESMFPVFERINDGLWRQIEEGTLTLEELLKIRWNTVFASLGISFDGVVFEDYFRKKLFSSAVPVPGSKELLEYLHGRYALCAASNGPYGQQINRLKVGGIDGYFRHVFISSEVDAQKPGKAFFDYCFEKLREDGFPNLVPEETIIIGDSVTADIRGGRAYGMQTCLYTRGASPDGKENEADHVVTSLEEIKHFL